jgi:hypothetical protein
VARENYSTLALAKPQDQTPELAHESLPRHILLLYLHSIFHTSTQNLKLFLNSFFPVTPEDSQYLCHLISMCPTCQRTNPHTPSRPGSFPTHQARGQIPGVDWQVDFTNMPRIKKHNYLLVLVDAFSGWVEAFPTSNKRASTVASIIVTHIIPRFGMPTSFQSDNGPEFTSQVTQTIIKALNISWHFHIPYHPPNQER